MSEFLAAAVVIGIVALVLSFFVKLGSLGLSDFAKAREIEAQADALEQQNQREG